MLVSGCVGPGVRLDDMYCKDRREIRLLSVLPAEIATSSCALAAVV